MYRGKEYVAACKHAIDAAILASFRGMDEPPAVIKYAHRITVWTEGSEEISASTSFKMAADIMEGRRNAHFKKSYEQSHGTQ